MATGSKSKSTESNSTEGNSFDKMVENQERATNRDPNKNLVSGQQRRKSRSSISVTCDGYRHGRYNSVDCLGHHKPRTLMESLLVAKMEAATLKANACDLKPVLTRMNSAESCSSVGSVGSSSLGSEFCRCDDCLLGIGDTFANNSTIVSKKVVCATGDEVKMEITVRHQTSEKIDKKRR